jgi:hypothetical protein
MFRKIVAPAVALASLISLGVLLHPTGAVGQQRQSAADRFVFGSDAVIDAPVSGNVQVVGGSVEVRDVIEGDLLVFGGGVRFAGRGLVKGNVIYAGGQVHDDGNRVRGRKYPLTSLEGAAASMTKSAVVLSLLAFWIVTAVAVTLGSGREVRLSSVEVRASALHCFVLGLVAMTSFVLTAIVFSYLVPYLIGVPLLAALGVFAILTKIYGMVAVFHAAGTLLAGSRTRRQLASRKWLRGDLAMTVIGVLLLGLIRLIPVVGPIVWSLASIFGIGVALATKFGRREPWFLTWRAAEA